MHNRDELSLVSKTHNKPKPNNKPRNNTPGAPAPREISALDSSGSPRKLIPQLRNALLWEAGAAVLPPAGHGKQRALPLAAWEPPHRPRHSLQHPAEVGVKKLNLIAPSAGEASFR